MDETPGGAVILIYLFLFVLALLWFFLPFAIFGTKDKLNQIISEAQKTNRELASPREQLSNSAISEVSDRPIPPITAIDS
jgi:hypothetical protein